MISDIYFWKLWMNNNLIDKWVKNDKLEIYRKGNNKLLKL